MTEKKQFHLKIKWKNREKTEAHEIVLYDGGQPLCELISVDDARLVRDIMNEQDKEIKQLKEQLEEETDRVIKLEQYIHTKLCPKSEHYNEKVVSAIINTILGDVE